MCGRYYVGDDDDEPMLAAVAALNRQENVKLSGEIFPTDRTCVLTGPSQAQVMRWGCALPDGRRVINARSETAARSPFFENSVRALRCVVPASYYFEWRRDGREKARYAIRPKGQRCWMAGLCRREGDESAFAVVTRPAARGISFIHDRMPLILTPEQVRMWLDRRCDALQILRCGVEDVLARVDEPFEQMTLL